MGFRTAAVITSTCFLLGALALASFAWPFSLNLPVTTGSVHMHVGILLCGLAKADYPILYGASATPNDVARAERYYLTLFNAPGAVPSLVHAMIGVCLLALATKIARWEETNLFFDGSSCALMIAAVGLYASVSVPNLRVLARQPIQAAQLTLGGRMRKWLNREMAMPADAAQIPEPLNDSMKFEVLSLLCASNNLIIAALVGILLFQGAQAYAHRQYQQELAKMEAADKARKAQ